jgi:hypothetical protein
MSDPAPIDLERLIGRALAQLPDLQAPETLFHRVMLAVHVRARRPWWRRSWQGWPAGLQALTLILLFSTAAAASYALGQALSSLSLAGLWTWLGGWLKPLQPAVDLLGTLANAGLLVFRSGGQQALLLAAFAVLAIYSACVGLGTACARIALHRIQD